MIKIAVVEDDLSFQKQISAFMIDFQKEKSEQFSVTFYDDGDGITKDYRSQFDIILMDIQMKFVDGMTAAEEIRKVDPKVIIIFITNLPQYAIKGYEVGALDYILKPLTYFSFSQKLARAISRIENVNTKYLTIPIKGGISRVNAKDIYYIESVGHNLIFHTVKGELTTPGTMKAVEEELAKYNFSRGNKGYIINLAHVEGMQDKCALVGNTKLLISRPRMSAFMKDLTRYWSEVN